MLEGAFAWIGQIAEWIGRFFPRREILDTTEGAIKYSGYIIPQRLRVKCGGFDGDFRVTVHGPGIHWWWPFTSKWSAHPTARQTDRLETQVLESKDGKTFIVSGTLTYSVEHLEMFVTQVWSPHTTVVDLAMAAIADVLVGLDWATIQEKQQAKTLKTPLKNAATAQLKDYGLEVVKLQINSLARARVLKVSQSISNEEN